MRATAKPLLISLLKGANKSENRDRLRTEFIQKLTVQELQQIDDALVAFLRVELDKMVMDKLINETYAALSENTETATDGS